MALAAALILAAAGLALPASGVSTHRVLLGLQDDANTLYGNPDHTFPILGQLHPDVLRVNLIWGGTPYGVATLQPTDASDPADPAYDWTLYDRIDRYASEYGIKLVFTILFAPSWANGGADRRHAPTSVAGWAALRGFAYAAARRYSGSYVPPVSEQDPTNPTTMSALPAVRYWTAWNEPNNPTWLFPQYVAGTMVSAQSYVKICNAIYGGVHATGIASEKVACGVTGPRGNNSPTSSRPEPDPLAFMRALKRYGLKKFDVYAHNPYYGSPKEAPSYKPKDSSSIQLGNIGVLLAQLTKLFGPKHLWITEYAYQTYPQDKLFGVSWAKQALYLKQADAIARANPRIDMLVWFMLVDDTNIDVGWQSGLVTATYQHKPAFAVFQKLPK